MIKFHDFPHKAILRDFLDPDFFLNSTFFPAFRGPAPPACAPRFLLARPRALAPPPVRRVRRVTSWRGRAPPRPPPPVRRVTPWRGRAPQPPPPVRRVCRVTSCRRRSSTPAAATPSCCDSAPPPSPCRAPGGPRHLPLP